MSIAALTSAAAAGLVGFVVASLLVHVRLTDPPRALVRINFRGREVPAVLGEPIAAASLVAVAALAAAGWAGWEPVVTGSMGTAVAYVIAVMWAAGALDDRRGDEASRGFRGHLAALSRGRLTGGILKIVAGAVAGAGSAALLFADDLEAAAATLLLVALGANAVNLFDRAPGRAAKLFLLAALPLMAFGHARWSLAAAGAVGAVVACLRPDLEERAMLGDAGANPLGALLGLGLAASLGGLARWTAVVALVALNAASERWSFSRAIEKTPWLRRLDGIGRK